jgi:mannose-1-phosphate guanylyltransferase
MAPPLRTILLAAGAGRRLADRTGGVPKQFWAADGRRSFVEQTAARVSALTPPDRIVTVVDRTHRPYVEALAEASTLGRVVYQPCDRGTAAGVMFGLAAVMDVDPDATVLLTPSDHGIADTALFHAGVREAATWIDAGHGGIVLFGVPPTSATGDYGWITTAGPTGAADSHAPRLVEAFVEKPSKPEAAELFACGAIWNTMVLLARARALVDLYRQHLPGVAEVFSTALSLPPHEREAWLHERYARLPAADFSRHVLGQTRGLAVYVWPAAIAWSDLGTPERLDAWRTAEPLPALPAAPVRPRDRRLALVQPQVA